MPDARGSSRCDGGAAAGGVVPVPLRCKADRCACGSRASPRAAAARRAADSPRAAGRRRAPATARGGAPVTAGGCGSAPARDTHPRCDRPDARTTGTPPEPSARAPGGRRALPFFSKRLMQDRLIQAQVRHQALELAILLPQLAQLAELADAQRPEALLPAVEGLLTDAHLAADLADRRARLGPAQGQGDLLVGELARLHVRGPPRPGGRAFGDRSLAQNARRGGLSFGEERREHTEAAYVAARRPLGDPEQRTLL